MTRLNDRAPGELRPTTITPNFSIHAEGSVLIEVGFTRVICTASIEDKVPPFLRGAGKGWVTAEYGMLLLDLAYEEDSKADVDMNIVKTSDGRFIEIQGTADAEPFSTDALTGLLALADKGINDLVAKQREIVGAILGR